MGVLFKQNHPIFWKTVQANGRNGHGIGFIDPIGYFHLIKPLLELFQGILLDGVFRQAAFFVGFSIVAQVFLHDVNFGKIQMAAKNGEWKSFPLGRDEGCESLYFKDFAIIGQFHIGKNL